MVVPATNQISYHRVAPCRSFEGLCLVPKKLPVVRKEAWRRPLRCRRACGLYRLRFKWFILRRLRRSGNICKYRSSSWGFRNGDSIVMLIGIEHTEKHRPIADKEVACEVECAEYTSTQTSRQADRQAGRQDIPGGLQPLRPLCTWRGGASKIICTLATVL